MSLKSTAQTQGCVMISRADQPGDTGEKKFKSDMRESQNKLPDNGQIC
jgi:hypothetical protein